MNKNHKSTLHLISILVLVITGIIFQNCSRGKAKENNPGKPLALPVYVVGTSDAETIKTYISTIEGKVNVEVRPQAEGLLQEIYVDEGTYVTKGQKLFKVDASAYQEVLNNALASQNVAKAKKMRCMYS